jgi:hypothetical protein
VTARSTELALRRETNGLLQLTGIQWHRWKYGVHAMPSGPGAVQYRMIALLVRCVCVCVPFGLDPTSEARVSIECWLPARGTYHEPVQPWIDCTLARLHSPTVRLVARSSGRWQGAENDGPGRGRGRGEGTGTGIRGALCGVVWCFLVLSGV